MPKQLTYRLLLLNYIPITFIVTLVVNITDCPPASTPTSADGAQQMALAHTTVNENLVQI